MRRRDLFKAAGAGMTALAAPRIGRAEKTNKLVFAYGADLSVLDPVATGYRPTRNHAYLVFDTLYGIDTSWAAQPQMGRGTSNRGGWADLDSDITRQTAFS